jgi:hypothetical protein
MNWWLQSNLVNNPNAAFAQQLGGGAIPQPGAGAIPGNQFGGNPFVQANLFGGFGGQDNSNGFIARNYVNRLNSYQNQLAQMSAQLANSGFDDPALQNEIENKSNAVAVGSKLLTGMTQLRKTLRDEALRRIQIAVS